MEIISGISFVVLAGFLQGTFILPMTYTRKWEWAHNWFVFSLLGMLLVNWLIASLSIENLTGIVGSIPTGILSLVLFFGLCWGIGAILFGKAMDMLGMALGYPVIMGINAAAGTIIPALIFSPDVFLQRKGVLIMLGSAITIIGIIVCTKASTLKSNNDTLSKSQKTASGLVLAIIAGFTSCLPNIGAAFSTEITDIAINSGVKPVLAGNVVWALFFTTGSLANMIYCLYLIKKQKSAKQLRNEFGLKNWLLILSMSLMWIGSFYLYGFGSSSLGSLGLIVGWPLLVSLSIIIGNLWGLYRGEWKNATAESQRKLKIGLIWLVVSVIIIGLSNV